MAAVENKTLQASAGRARIPISMRLKAWWDGNELMLRRKALAEKGSSGGPETPKRDLDRITLLQEIWGEGLNDPGDTEFILHLVKPLGLDPSMTVVDLGAGLGGPARAMVEHFGCWVQGLEATKELAERAKELSEVAGMAKKAEIIYFDPTRHIYRAGTADCVLSKEFFCKIQDKEHILRLGRRRAPPSGLGSWRGTRREIGCFGKLVDAVASRRHASGEKQDDRDDESA